MIRFSVSKICLFFLSLLSLSKLRSSVFCAMVSEQYPVVWIGRRVLFFFVFYTLNAPWIAHISTLFSQIPWLKHPNRLSWIEKAPRKSGRNIMKQVENMSQKIVSSQQQQSSTKNSSNDMLKRHDTFPAASNRPNGIRYSVPNVYIYIYIEYVMVIPHFSGWLLLYYYNDCDVDK